MTTWRTGLGVFDADLAVPVHAYRGNANLRRYSPGERPITRRKIFRNAPGSSYPIRHATSSMVRLESSSISRAFPTLEVLQLLLRAGYRPDLQQALGARADAILANPEHAWHEPRRA